MLRNKSYTVENPVINDSKSQQRDFSFVIMSEEFEGN